MYSLRTAISVAIFIVLAAAMLQAQTATGEINGTISDPNGAAVPGAIVKLINQATKGGGGYLPILYLMCVPAMRDDQVNR